MQKDFDKWNSKKKQLNENRFSDYVRTKEVWWCSLGVNIGFEQDGKHEYFERPILVIRKFSRDVVLAVPISTKVKDNKYYVNFIHNDHEFSALISQIRLISTKRLSRKIYEMSGITFDKIREALRNLI